MTSVALLSGGLDSTVLAYSLADPLLLSFDYGQRHVRELEAAENIADTLGAKWHVIDISADGGFFAALLPGSSLTDKAVDVPDGHYTDETMKATVVPNRNAMMLSIAYAVAVAEHADGVYFAAHAGDHAIYPDCRPEFVDALHHALALGNAWAEPVPFIKGPFLHMSKADIVANGHTLKVPFRATWSCYRGGAVHCGRCGTCVERAEAFAVAGVDDPTEYETKPVW